LPDYLAWTKLSDWFSVSRRESPFDLQRRRGRKGRTDHYSYHVHSISQMPLVRMDSPFWNSTNIEQQQPTLKTES
jgi:hypothetical protein